MYLYCLFDRYTSIIAQVFDFVKNAYAYLSVNTARKNPLIRGILSHFNAIRRRKDRSLAVEAPRFRRILDRRLGQLALQQI